MKSPFVIKICSKCKRILVANEINFSKQKGGKWGLNSICKKCNKKYRDEHKEERNEKYRQYYNEHKEEIDEKHRKYYSKHKEEIDEKHRQYYNEHKEEINKKHKKYNQEHQQELNEIKKQDYKNNPEKYFNKRIKRRQREQYLGNGITKDQWLEMMSFFNWSCAYSGIHFSSNNKEKVRSVDHIIPLTKGGLNEPWNCVPMYRNYNCSKYANDMLDWYIQQDFFDIDRLLKIYDWIEYAYKKWGNK